MSSENNKRIAKNTLMLYGRMLLMMLVSLYTSRVILATLGVEDFGIYNVVAGVVVLFSFLNSAMSSATQRFLNFEIGKNDVERTRQVFSMSLIVHFCIALIVVILAETIGLWFLNTKLNIPIARMDAARWVYQFSVASTVVGIIRVPYNATIIAHERMSFYAYLGIAEALIKLGVVFLLLVSVFDKLILFAGLLLVSSTSLVCVCVGYCRRSFTSSKIMFFYDSKLFAELMSFSGWSLLGGVANMCSTQGINMVMNIFCGVTVNAAMGVANQVNRAVYQFVTNFQLAFNPQIIKSYSSGNRDYFIKLLFNTSKYSFFLMWFLSLPVLLNANFLLSLWLKNPPGYSSDFVRWTLAFALIESLSGPLWMSIQATGKIRNYQLIVSLFIAANLPLAYLILSLGCSPVWVLIVRATVNAITLIWRVFYLKHRVDLPSWSYVKDVLLVVSLVAFLSTLLPFAIWYVFSGWIGFIGSSMTSVLSVAVGIWFLGLGKQEHSQIRAIALNKMKVLSGKG